MVGLFLVALRGRSHADPDTFAAYHVGRTLLRLVLYAADAGTLDEGSPFIKALLEYWKVSHIDELLEKTVNPSQLSLVRVALLTSGSPSSTRFRLTLTPETQRTIESCVYRSVSFHCLSREGKC